MTTTDGRPDLATWVPATNTRIWDKYHLYAQVNYNELFVDLVTPLTYSVLDLTAGEALRIHEEMGTLPHLNVAPEERRYINALFYGRAYWNYDLIKAAGDLTPGIASGSIEEQFGGKERMTEDKDDGAERVRRRAVVRAWGRYLRMGRNLRPVTETNDGAIEAYRARFLAGEEPSGDLREQIRFVVGWLQYTFHPHFAGAAWLSSSFEGLRVALLETGDEFVHLQPKLIAGLADVESGKPSVALWDLSRAIAEKPEVRRLFQATEPPTVDEIGAVDADLRDQVTVFLDAYGFRGPDEIELSATAWEENPLFVLRIVQSFLDQPDDASPRAHQARCEREREETVAYIEERLDPFRRHAFRAAVAELREYIVMRERTKSQWVRLQWCLRQTVRRLADDLVGQRVIERAEDVYYLVLDELLDENLDAAHARAVVAERRAEYAIFEQLDVGEEFTSTAPMPRWRDAPVEAPSEAVQKLTGMGVSPGKVTGRAHVIENLKGDVRLQPGDILVAPSTDAAWTPLFFTAAGVVVDIGGPLSHGAVVAREFGIPAIVSAPQASRVIRTGQTITIDGTTGEITIDR